MNIQLNSDLGEGFGSWKMGMDKEIMPFIDMANIACGFHASDPLIMQETVKLAKQESVKIGAHPGYPDLVGFGRRSLKCSTKEIEAFVIYQIGALQAVCASNETSVKYVKPHGALYNDMMKDDTIFLAIATGISRVDKNLEFMILSTSNNAHYEALVKPLGLKLIYEVFADRTYTNEGYLVARTQQGAVLHDKKSVLQRIDLLQQSSELKTIDGSIIKMQADSICVHGDNDQAIAFVKSLREYINR